MGQHGNMCLLSYHCHTTMHATPHSPTPKPYPHPAGGWEAIDITGFNLLRDDALPSVGGPAQIIVPAPAERAVDPCVLRLTTLRSDAPLGSDELAERLCSVWGTRRVLFMHPLDMNARGLAEGDLAHVTTVAHDGQRRELANLRVVPYELPRGSVSGYAPECRALLPGQHAPKGQSIAVRVKNALV